MALSVGTSREATTGTLSSFRIALCDGWQRHPPTRPMKPTRTSEHDSRYQPSPPGSRSNASNGFELALGTLTTTLRRSVRYSDHCHGTHNHLPPAASPSWQPWQRTLRWHWEPRRLTNMEESRMLPCSNSPRPPKHSCEPRWDTTPNGNAMRHPYMAPATNQHTSALTARPPSTPSNVGQFTRVRHTAPATHGELC